MTLAIFDLDNTLLAGDSDHAWGQYLARRNIVDAAEHARKQDHYFAQYQAGTLDIHEFLRFQLRALADNTIADLERWRADFMETEIRPLISDTARDLVAGHRDQGHELMIITATNSFITRPIADEFGVDLLLATEPQQIDGRFTGEVEGIPAFRDGKVDKLAAWLDANGGDLTDSWFYSDSHNDLPLLLAVTHPVAVDPDRELTREARRRGWQIISLHGANAS